jgi:hypothetical protein
MVKIIIRDYKTGESYSDNLNANTTLLEIKEKFSAIKGIKVEDLCAWVGLVRRYEGDPAILPEVIGDWIV